MWECPDSSYCTVSKRSPKQSGASWLSRASMLVRKPYRSRFGFQKIYSADIIEKMNYRQENAQARRFSHHVAAFIIPFTLFKQLPGTSEYHAEDFCVRQAGHPLWVKINKIYSKTKSFLLWSIQPLNVCIYWLFSISISIDCIWLLYHWINSTFECSTQKSVLGLRATSCPDKFVYETSNSCRPSDRWLKSVFPSKLFWWR